MSRSTTIGLPDSIIDEESPVDLVVVCLWDAERWYIGLFDGGDIRRLLAGGMGSYVARRLPHSPELHFKVMIDIRSDRRVTFSGGEVTRNFAEENGRWDDIFPSRFAQENQHND